MQVTVVNVQESLRIRLLPDNAQEQAIIDFMDSRNSGYWCADRHFVDTTVVDPKPLIKYIDIF